MRLIKYDILQRRITIRKELFLAFMLSLAAFFLAVSYFLFFSEALNNSEWLSIDGFTRIVIPDTFFYKDLMDFSDPLGYGIRSGGKNALGPSLLWFIASGKWSIALFFNAVFLFFTLLYIARICNFMGFKQKKVLVLMALMALLPSTLYNSIGALKEIPGLLFLTAFFYHYLKNDRIKWLLYAFLSVLFRYQFALVFLIFLIADIFQRRALLYAFCALMFFSAIYPFISSLEILCPDATVSYRELFGLYGSFGGFVEFVRATIPGASAVAVLIRITQTIFEPLISFVKIGTFFEYGDISLITGAYVFSSLILLCYWMGFLKRFVCLLTNCYSVHRDVIRLYTLCLAFIFPVGGFSFIHHRYLYPITALVLVAGTICLKPGALQRDYKHNI